MRRGLRRWRTLSPQRSKKYLSPLNAWNVLASSSSSLPAARNVSSNPFSTKLRYGKDSGRQLKSPVTTAGRSSSWSSGILRRISSLPFARARLLTWSRCVFKCRKERPALGLQNFAQFAERTTLVRHAEEYLFEVSLSQNPPESSTSSRVGSKKIALNSWGLLLPAPGPRMWAYSGSSSR